MITKTIERYPNGSNITELHTTDQDKAIKVVVKTENLVMESVTQAAHKVLASIYSDPEAMKLYASGVPLSSDNAQNRITNWINRAAGGDPFHALLITKSADQTPVGTIVMGHSDLPGISELAYNTFDQYRGKDFAGEAVSAVAKSLAPVLKAKKYELENKPFYLIKSTSHPDDSQDQENLENAGFKKVDQISVERFKADRFVYHLAV